MPQLSSFSLYTREERKFNSLVSNLFSRSSRTQMFFKVFLEISQYLQENVCVENVLIKLDVNETPAQVFPVNIDKFLQTAFFIEHLQWLLLYFIYLVSLISGKAFDKLCRLVEKEKQDSEFIYKTDRERMDEQI